MPEVDRCVKKSTVKAARGRNSFTRDEVLIALFRIPGKYSTGTSEGPTIAVGRLALVELQLGMLAGSPQRPIIPEPQWRIIATLRRR